MKKTTASMPQDLASANVAYCQRLAQLAQESQQRWIELGQRLASDNAGQYLAALPPLQPTDNWQQLAPALGELTRKRWQAQLEAGQAITHAALQEQATLAAGLGAAMCEWFKHANSSGANADNSPLGQMWSAMSNQMAAACAAMHDASQPGARHDR
ncbi:hypothetical protein [Achromobacter sp.]|uniref:hypothetical protein n=1 Tax=Achromobacter sp. TaxID=134375 RepID=UPI0028A821E4|nr:hypothetical protein [Achromobacter sp.]